MKGALQRVLEILKSSYGLPLHIVQYKGKGYLYKDKKKQLYLIRTASLTEHKPNNTRQTYQVWPLLIRHKDNFDFLIFGMFERGKLKYIFKVPSHKITFKATMIQKHTLTNRLEQGWELIYRSWG